MKASVPLTILALVIAVVVGLSTGDWFPACVVLALGFVVALMVRFDM